MINHQKKEKNYFSFLKKDNKNNQEIQKRLDEIEAIWKEIKEDYFEELKNENQRKIDRKLNELVYISGESAGKKIDKGCKSFISYLLSEQKMIAEEEVKDDPSSNLPIAKEQLKRGKNRLIE